MGKVIKRLILTGERAAGKTSFCRELNREALRAGLTTTGLLTETERDKKLSIRDLYTDDMRELALINPDFYLSSGTEPGSAGKSPLQTRRWIFNKEALEWGNIRIKTSPAADIFILDEAGILEFERDGGWTEGIKRADRMIDRLVLIVVRPELKALAFKRWKEADLITINPACRGEIPHQIRQILRTIKPE